MPFINPADMAPLLSRDQRLLGIDHGSKIIGLALSDVSRTVATPFGAINHTKFQADMQKLGEIIDKNDVAGLVIGLPLNMDGTEGPRCQSVRQFGKNILAVRDIPIAFSDERWSTTAVTRTLIEADLSRSRRAGIVDKVAAAYILQGFLDRLKAG